MFIVVTCASLIVIFSVGIRQSFGLFLQPISDSFGTGREIYSLAVALQNLVLGLPLMGFVADRFGPRWVVVGGGILFSLSLAGMVVINQPLGLYVNLGLLTGLALSCTTYVVILGAVAQVVPPEKRSTAFGITTAAGSMGMFLIVPGVQALLSNLGWQNALLSLAGLSAVIILLAFGLPKTVAQDTTLTENFDSLPKILLRAKNHSGYWLLNLGFFVCGFHVAFIATHLPAFLSDKGANPMAGATALAVIGFANIIGSYFFGFLGDRYRKKFLLSFLYLGRALVISLFLLFPITNTSAIIFGASIGFLWLATVPLTSGMVAQIFGSRYLSTLYGLVFFSHQIGSFLGVWLGGRLYDLTGSYTIVWLIAIALGFLAALVHLPISDKAVLHSQVQPSA